MHLVQIHNIAGHNGGYFFVFRSLMSRLLTEFPIPPPSFTLIVFPMYDNIFQKEDHTEDSNSKAVADTADEKPNSLHVDGISHYLILPICIISMQYVYTVNKTLSSLKLK